MASFVQKKKSFEILWSKKIFFAYLRNLEPPTPPHPSPLVRNHTHLAWSLPSPFVVRTVWMTLNEKAEQKTLELVCFILKVLAMANQSENKVFNDASFS